MSYNRTVCHIVHSLISMIHHHMTRIFAQASASAIVILCDCIYMVLPRVERVVQIYGGKTKRDPWTVKNIVSINGIEFVDLQKTDSGFNRFVTGSAKGTSCTFDTTLRKRRNMAMLGHTDNIDIMGNELPAPSRHTLNKMKQGMATAPPYVDLEFPEVTVGDEHAPATTLRVATTKDFNSGVQLELSTGMLHYVRVAMLATMTGESAPKRSKPTVYAPPGTRWVKLSGKTKPRFCFRATRPHAEHEGQKSKFIVCTNPDDDDAIERARQQALRWIAGHDDVDGDADDQCDDSDSHEDSRDTECAA
jgi:hypothetical protein